MKAKKLLSIITLAASFGIPCTANAGIYTDDLGKCLVTASTDEEKQQLVQWIFFALSLNPSIQPFSKITPEQRDLSDRNLAKIFERLLGDACSSQAKDALKYEGTSALSQSFKLLGEVASRQLFDSPVVVAGTAKFAEYIDEKALIKKLGIPAK